AAGIATLNEIIDQDLPAQAAKKGEDFLTSLRFLAAKYPMIKEVRGLGLLIGIEFNSDDLIGKAAYDFIGSLVVGELFNRFHIVTAYTLNNPTVVRFEPALNIEIEKLDYVVDSLDQVLKANKSNWKLLGSTVRNFISR
ncbi:MAG: aminotransferase class III-fold pyridoxal phosphate-dependent enzyme, partial [Candidatus Berkelbacteria bacterium]|nr:aminotransferase class III-fold pyridoxal phosphate-dependent enzyme [Candidatus Berkelbacteria bacterium]